MYSRWKRVAGAFLGVRCEIDVNNMKINVNIFNTFRSKSSEVKYKCLGLFTRAFIRSLSVLTPTTALRLFFSIIFFSVGRI